MRAAAADPRLRPAALSQIERLQLATAERIARGLRRRRRRRDLPGDRRPAGHLDVDRRPDRPLRRADRSLARSPQAPRRGGRRPELEALKEAKYREIRDAELDHAAGKLSDEDFALLDAELRSEAVEILDRPTATAAGTAMAPRRGEVAEKPAEPV